MFALLIYLESIDQKKPTLQQSICTWVKVKQTRIRCS